MTTVVPAVGTNGPSAPGAAPDPDGATTLTVAQRRWCIGAAVAVMGLASLGTALYQTSSSPVDPAADTGIAPIETSTSGSSGTPGAATLPDPSLGGLGVGAPSADGLPLSLLPAQTPGAAYAPGLALPSGGGLPASSGLPAYTPQAQTQPRVVDSAPAALPPGAQLPAGATAPLSGAAATAPGAARGTAASPYRQTGTPGVIAVAPGQAPPPGYRRVYPAAPRAQVAPGQAGTYQQRAAPGTQQRAYPGTAQPGYRTAPNAQATPGTTATPQQRRTPGTSTSPSGTAKPSTGATPSGTAKPPAGGGLLGGLGG